MLLTSYSFLKRDIEYYVELVFHTCFLDETQNIKNPSTQAGVSVRRLRAQLWLSILKIKLKTINIRQTL